MNCSYKIGGQGKKKNAAQRAYEKRISELLYQDRFDRIQKDKSTSIPV